VRHRRPLGLTILAVVVALALLSPIGFLVAQSYNAGVSTVWHLIFSGDTRQLLWNTVRLTVVVTALCAVIGTGAAYLVERTDLPGRGVWAVLVVVPLAIPDFVVAFGWTSLESSVSGFRGAVLVMTLAVYPLVYLPTAASFRNADPGQEEVARSLGVGRWAAFWRITIWQSKTAILGGCLLVTLVMLAEYGAFEILGYQTFTTSIFDALQLSFSVSVASALALVLVVFGIVVLGGEALVRGRRRESRSGPMAQRVLTRHRLGRAKLPVLLLMAGLVLLALGVPLGASIDMIVNGRNAPGVAGASLLTAAGYTAGYSALAAALATVAALPVALLSVRHAGSAQLFLERSTYLVLAVPGVVVALALNYFATHGAPSPFSINSAPLLIGAYSILFFPLALVGVRTSVAQAPPTLEEVARSLGQRRLAVFCRVTLPLIAPGLAAAFCLVFLSAVTELTATLLMVPNGVQTLATQFWFYEHYLSYGQAAPFALAMIVVAAVPSYVLGRFFDRRPSRTA
jgi:iron(III) transport system permease protein